jgi:hypothetical protein
MSKQMSEIHSGNFSKGDKAQGNFTGYTSDGEKFFINKALLASTGWTKDADVKFPFYAITASKDIQTRDENGELTDTLVKRDQALSIFKSEDDMINAFNSSARMQIKAKVNLAQIATASGLSTSTINSLLENA